jgi:AcrR family transcriptional regulator
MNRKAADLQPHFQAALQLVAADGLKGLSLRPLAELLGTTAPALIRRFGGKDALVSSLVEVAIAEDGAFLDGWLARIRALDVCDGTVMAEAADAILSDLAGPQAQRTRFYCELLQAIASRPEMATMVAAWSARRLDFWRAATERLPPGELADVLHAFSIGEAGYGLALGDVAAYRWLRRLSLRRLCCGLIPTDPSEDQRQFQVFREALGELLDDRDRPATPPMTEWQAGVAGHISALIIAEGADAVTHRAIAARAGLANSTLAYHFPRQEDLLRAGLEDVVARVHSATGTTASDAPPEFQLTSIQSARATFAIALVATRMPGLKAVAADLRRRRGENYVGYLERQLGRAAFDVVAAQAISLTGMGQLTLDAVLDPASNNTAGFTLTDRMRAAALAGQ